MSNPLSVQQYIDGILASDRYILSRAITLVESNLPDHQAQAQQVLEQCLPHSGKSIRIGITGVPGVGKSTFIEALGTYIIANKQRKLAVLAIDPSSELTKGSILGDKTRMEGLSNNKHAYIRPTATSGSLGGVARKTRESIILCEAAGFDTIFIETVGVGQSETAVHSMVDFFLLLMLAGAGDELQGIKRGIIEMADAIAINKADGDNQNPSKAAVQEYKRAIHLYPPKDSGWIPKVTACSALHNQHINTVWQIVEDHHSMMLEKGLFETHRSAQNKYWLHETIGYLLLQGFYQNKDVKNRLPQLEQAVVKNQMTAEQAARILLNLH